MIREFSIVPRAENNRARLLVTVLGIVGAITFGVSSFIESYRGIVSLVAMALIVAALTVAVKYILSEYTYSVFDADGEWLFVVSQRSGKRFTTLCRVSLASVVSIERVAPKDIDKGGDFARYSYIPTVSPETVCEMTVVSRYERAKISLQLTEEMRELLVSYAEEARRLSPDSEE